MNYIYDIVLNFNKEYYSFYEWNRKDNILGIFQMFPKIPKVFTLQINFDGKKCRQT